MKTALNRRRILIASVFLIACGSAAYGSDEDHEDEDHDRAFRALREGDARPLTEIIATVKKEIGGDVVGVEFESESGRYVYEIKIVTPDGRLREVYVDAMTAEILSDGRD
jgi:uncharacterized membrane protein YkoI